MLSRIPSSAFEVFYHHFYSDIKYMNKSNQGTFSTSGRRLEYPFGGNEGCFKCVAKKYISHVECFLVINTAKFCLIYNEM